MNGEAFQIARIVTAFKTGNKFEFTDYEKEIHFSFLPKGIISKSDLWVSEPDKWLDIFPEVGIEKIYLIMDTRTNSKIRSTLGFSNSQPVIIMSVYKYGRVTYWKPHWNYSDTIKGWTVEYTENKWHNAPKSKPIFENNIRDFKSILDRTSVFAYNINENRFGDVFKAASELLIGTLPEKEYKYADIPDLPTENRLLFNAASLADVFGAMGSWNDSPPGSAAQRGMGEEYDALSDELLKQLRIAIMYAINEW